jgi:hypothetical protein
MLPGISGFRSLLNSLLFPESFDKHWVSCYLKGGGISHRYGVYSGNYVKKVGTPTSA